uniref:C1q domain-containing protein n=1 Tax=Cyprinus carpio carpio TaxID=630221 RepID=A0A8C1DJB5_CYPCA
MLYNNQYLILLYLVEELRKENGGETVCLNEVKFSLYILSVIYHYIACLFIAFSASLVESGNIADIGPFTTEITVTFRNVFTNIGNDYNYDYSAIIQETAYLLLFALGIFTAPLKGAYGTCSNSLRVVIAHARQDQYDVNSSKAVVLILEVGDVVYVRLWSGRSIYDNGNNYNTFSGHLLFP